MKDLVYQKVEQMWHDNVRELAARLVALLDVRTLEYPGLRDAYGRAVKSALTAKAISAHEAKDLLSFTGEWRAVIERIRDHVMTEAERHALSHGKSNGGPPSTRLLAAQDTMSARKAATAVVFAAAAGDAVSVDRLTAATSTLQQETETESCSRLEHATSAYFRAHPEDRPLAPGELRAAVESRVKSLSIVHARDKLEESVRWANQPALSLIAAQSCTCSLTLPIPPSHPHSWAMRARLLHRCQQQKDSSRSTPHSVVYQSATRQLAALKKKIPAQVATLNILSKASGAEVVTVTQCYDGALTLGSTAKLAALRQLVTAYGALRRRTEQKQFLQNDAAGLLEFFRRRQARLQVIRTADSGEPPNWPAQKGADRLLSYYPHDCTGTARAGLQSLAGSVSHGMRVLHEAARRTLSARESFSEALEADLK